MEKAPVRGGLKRLPDWIVKTNINIQSAGSFYQKVAPLTQVQLLYASEDDIDEKDLAYHVETRNPLSEVYCPLYISGIG